MDYAIGTDLSWYFVFQGLAIKHCPHESQVEGVRLAKKLRWTMIKLRIGG